MNVQLPSKIFLLTLLIISCVKAQFPDTDIKFDHIYPGKNTLQNSITCFLQDRQGFMWIGTKGGLFRYDGYEFTCFVMEPNNDNSLSDNHIRCMIEYSGDELLLIGTNNGGLNIYDKKRDRFTRFLHVTDDSTSIGSNNIFDILEDENGKIWLAAVTGGLNVFDIDKRVFKKYFINKKNSNSSIRPHIKSLCLDELNGLWVGTRFGGLFLFDRKSESFARFSKQKELNILQPDDIWTISKDHFNNLWIGTEFDGIYLLKKERNNYKFEKMGKAHGFDKRAALKIYCDSKGTIWVGAWAGGIYKFNFITNHFTQYKNNEENPQSLSSNHVLAIYEDDAGALWVGTHAGGINLIQANKWKFYPYQFTKFKKNTVHLNQVRSIYFQKQLNTLWVGTIQGLFKINTSNGDQKRYQYIDGNHQSILHNAINAICQDRDLNFLWLGTPLGLTRMNTKTEKFQHYQSAVIDSSGPCNINITKILRDKDGLLWIGTTHIGLVRFNPEKQKFKTYKIYSADSSAFPLLPIKTFIENDNGKLYLGTSEGIQIFDKRTEKFQRFSTDINTKSITNLEITSILKKSTNILWIGTANHGLIKCEEKTGAIKYFSIKDGLASNCIYGIVEDKNGIFYLSTNNGISCFDSYREQFKNFGIEDGLHGVEFTENSFYKTSTDKFFFGGINGFTMFSSVEMAKNDFIPPVHITKFKILNSKDEPVKNILFTASVELSYKNNSFSIDFVALNYVNPKRNQYLYKLENFDQTWQEIDNLPVAVYKNVAPGNYTFKVIGSNNDGIWNEAGDSLSIYVKPPFWKTSIFKIFMLCFFVGSIYLIIRRRFALLRKEARIRQQYTHNLISSQEQERRRIAAELHDSLGQDLLIIKNQTSLALKKQDSEKTKKLMQISNVAEEAIKNVRQISHNLHPYQLEKVGLTNALKAMAEKVNEASNITFECEIENIDGLLPSEHEINCFRIVQELLNNIIKHSQAKQAWIKIKRIKQKIEIGVRDNGIGFNYEKLLNEKQGFGLIGIQERIEIIKGKLKIKSNQESGTTFLIIIPIAQ